MIDILLQSILDLLTTNLKDIEDLLDDINEKISPEEDENTIVNVEETLTDDSNSH